MPSLQNMLPAYDLAANLPPLALPTLSVNIEGRVNLHYSFVEKFGLHKQQPIDLIPPRPGSDYWHLDLRPEADARVYWYQDQRPRFRTKHALPTLQYGGKELLHLCLLPGQPLLPNYYPLLPIQCLTHAFATFLETQAVAARTR